MNQSDITPVNPTGTLVAAVGMVDDGVSNAISLTPAPEFSSSIGSDYLLAIGSIQERMPILLDIEKLIAGTVMGLATQIPQ